ncbi:MAG: FkbM family methyltransferase [Anaerolineales bacterium]|nr:FkbM family methyltransferase [Anaerolineales bacterium]
MNNMQRALGRVINRLLEPLGYRISRRPKTASAFATPQGLGLQDALARVSRRGLAVNTLIDVGASTGQWTRVARPYFPEAHCLLIEANTVHAADLRRFQQETSRVDYVLTAAGDTVGEIYFDAREPFGGLASHTPLEVPTIRVPVTTIDTLVAERRLQPPYLIKLDTHGFEVPILEGARQALTDTSLLIIEAYNFRLNPDSLKYYELCAYLNARGFMTIDLCDPLFRTSDNALWQFDLFFARAEGVLNG